MDAEKFDKLIGEAILREIEAYEFYHDVEESVSNEAVKAVFRELANEEKDHEGLLERYRFDPTLKLKINGPGFDYKVAEATPLPTLSKDMAPADAIALAMKKELAAVDFYKGLAEATEDGETKELLQNLANMELNHKVKLETVFTDIGYPEVF